jgi:hypothetical protein
MQDMVGIAKNHALPKFPLNGMAFPSRGREGPGLGEVPCKAEGQGMPGVRRTRSLARSKKTRELVTTGSPKHSGIPCAMVLTVSFVLAPETGLCCLRYP